MSYFPQKIIFSNLSKKPSIFVDIFVCTFYVELVECVCGACGFFVCVRGVWCELYVQSLLCVWFVILGSVCGLWLLFVPGLRVYVLVSVIVFRWVWTCVIRRLLPGINLMPTPISVVFKIFNKLKSEHFTYYHFLRICL